MSAMIDAQKQYIVVIIPNRPNLVNSILVIVDTMSKYVCTICIEILYSISNLAIWGGWLVLFCRIYILFI